MIWIDTEIFESLEAEIDQNWKKKERRDFDLLKQENVNDFETETDQDMEFIMMLRPEPNKPSLEYMFL